jgi:hypothetical protein
MTGKTKKLVAGAGLVLVIALWLTHKKRPDTVTETPKRAAVTVKTTAPKKKALAARAPTAAAAAVRPAIASRLVRAPLGDRLTVNLSVEKHCNGGAFEAMRQESQRSRSSRLLLTVESLDREDREFRPQVVELPPPAEMAKGYAHTFKVDGKGSRRQIGVFVCKDDEGQGRCLGKATKSGDDLRFLHMQALQQAGKGGGKTPDLIYAFQYLVLGGNALEALPASLASPASFDALGGYAGRLEGGGAAAVRYTASLTPVLRTIPAHDVKVGASTVTLSLIDGGGPPCGPDDIAAFRSDPNVFSRKP